MTETNKPSAEDRHELANQFFTKTGLPAATTSPEIDPAPNSIFSQSENRLRVSSGSTTQIKLEAYNRYLSGHAATLHIQMETAPIKIDKDGAARVGGTRVLLQTVISAFHRGDSPEQIVDSFDVLSLADVYTVVAYYLNHREEVDEFIREQDEAAAVLRREIEATQPQMLELQRRMEALKKSRS